jgi:hypothetical protein
LQIWGQDFLDEEARPMAEDVLAMVGVGGSRKR